MELGTIKTPELVTEFGFFSFVDLGGGIEPNWVRAKRRTAR